MSQRQQQQQQQQQQLQHEDHDSASSRRSKPRILEKGTLVKSEKKSLLSVFSLPEHSVLSERL